MSNAPVLRGIGLLIVLVFAASCNSTQDKQLAEQGVAQFHHQLDSEQYHAMYQASDTRLREVSTEPDFTALLAAVHRKLGKVQTSDLRSFQVGWYAGQGKTVTLFYETRFSDGAGEERFIWHIDSGHPLLVGYNINSNALITK